MGQVAYRMELQPQAQIHLVAHVSKVKKHIPLAVHITTDLSLVTTDLELIIQLLCILERALGALCWSYCNEALCSVGI